MKTKTTDPNAKIDPLTRHLDSFQNKVLSYCRVVEEIMGLKAERARRLLKDLIDSPIETPSSAIVSRLSAAKLLQTEVKHRLKNDGQSLLPFNVHDYIEAVEYGKTNEHKYMNVESVETDENGDTVVVEKKRGRKGASFNTVKEFLLNDPKYLDAKHPVKEVAALIAEQTNVPEGTAVQYVYKCRRLAKQGSLK